MPPKKIPEKIQDGERVIIEDTEEYGQMSANLKAVQSENESAKKALCELESEKRQLEFLVQDLRDDADKNVNI